MWPTFAGKPSKTASGDLVTWSINFRAVGYYGSFPRDNTADSPDRSKRVVESAIQKIPVDRIVEIPDDRLGDCIQLTSELMAVRAFIDPRATHALWEYHSCRHNTPWLPPGSSNIAALEAAATHFSLA